MRDRIIAVALLTDDDVTRLGGNFKRLWPVDETPCFQGLLSAIDEADRELRLARSAERDRPVMPVATKAGLIR